MSALMLVLTRMDPGVSKSTSSPPRFLFMGPDTENTSVTLLLLTSLGPEATPPRGGVPGGTCSPLTLRGVRTTRGIITAFFLCLPDWKSRSRRRMLKNSAGPPPGPPGGSLLTCLERLSLVWVCWVSVRPCWPAALLRRVWGWLLQGAGGSVEQEALDELSSTEASEGGHRRLVHAGAPRGAPPDAV